VTPGTSGGVTALGTLAAVLGAGVMAGAAFVLGASLTTAVAALGGGVAGMLIDSLLGATVQARYRCERCQVTTEQSRHACGQLGARIQGLKWIDNDAVNFLATGSGGALTLGMTYLL